MFNRRQLLFASMASALAAGMTKVDIPHNAQYPRSSEICTSGSGYFNPNQFVGGSGIIPGFTDLKR